MFAFNKKKLLLSALALSLVSGCGPEGASFDGAETEAVEIGSTSDALTLNSGWVPLAGSLIENPLHDRLSQKKEIWESGRRSIEYRSTDVGEFRVKASVDTTARTATMTVEIPNVRVNAKFIKDRRILPDKKRDVRVDFRDTKIVATFDVSSPGSPKLKSKTVTVRKAEMEGEGLILDIVESVVGNYIEEYLRSSVESEVKKYVDDKGDDLVKKALNTLSNWP